MQYPIRSMRTAFAMAAFAATAALAPIAHAQSTHWVDWTEAPTLHSAVGTLTLPSGKVKVKFSGPSMYFIQTGTPSDTDYWTSGSPDAYSVTGRPIGTDLIAFKGGDVGKFKITFSKPVTNPVFAILTLGRASIPVRYVFDQTPTLLSSGVGFWGGCSSCLKVKGNKLTGTEGHGVVQFAGTYTAITWKEPDFEEWHGITVGAIVAP